MKNVVIGMVITGLTVFSGFAQASENKVAKPENKAACFKILRELGPVLKKNNVSSTLLQVVQVKGSSMAKLCINSKFDEAFTLYQEIEKIAGINK